MGCLLPPISLDITRNFCSHWGSTFRSTWQELESSHLLVRYLQLGCKFQGLQAKGLGFTHIPQAAQAAHQLLRAAQHLCENLPLLHQIFTCSEGETRLQYRPQKDSCSGDKTPSPSYLVRPIPQGPALLFTHHSPERVTPKLLSELRAHHHP